MTTLAERMKKIADVTERSMQRAHDDLNWADPADTAEERQKCDAWFAKHFAASQAKR